MPVSKISIFGRQLAERRRVAVDRPALARRRSLAVDRVADHVPDAAERLVSDRDRDRRARVDDLRAAREPVGRVHRDCADAIVAEMLLDLGDQLTVVGGDAESAVDVGQPVREDGVEDDAFDLDDAACVAAVRSLVGHGSPGEWARARRNLADPLHAPDLNRTKCPTRPLRASEDACREGAAAGGQRARRHGEPAA